MSKYLIIGGVAGGASVAARLRRLNENDAVVMFERGPHVSFSNCCLPYHLSGVVKTAEELVLMTPELFAKQYNIDARVNNEVIAIDKLAKFVTVRNTLSGDVYQETYDKLVLSPGANPIVPVMEGTNGDNVYTIRNVGDIDKLKQAVNIKNVQHITVIGGGFIGLEAAENLKKAGYDITLVEASSQVLRNFDGDMVQTLHKSIIDHGVELIVNDAVEAIRGDHVHLQSGKIITSQVIICAIGVRPEITLAHEAGLAITASGAIAVNNNYVTSDRDIYAVGDAISVYHSLLQQDAYLPLAGPAQKAAHGAADHIHGKAVDNRGYIGSGIVKVFDMHAASTGLNERMLASQRPELHSNSVMLIPGDSVGLMPTANPLHLKVIFEVPTGRVLGAQAIGRGNVDKRIDVIATAIKFGATVYDLKDLELCYAPPFGTAKDAVNMAGYIAVNLLQGDFNQVLESDVRELVASGANIIDVREEDEFAAGHIRNAINIPLSQLRERLNEFSPHETYYIHCRSGQRSYNAVLALQQHGIRQVFNVRGGFMGVCFYEYFTDVTQQRAPIVTKYNFA